MMVFQMYVCKEFIFWKSFIAFSKIFVLFLTILYYFVQFIHLKYTKIEQLNLNQVILHVWRHIYFSQRQMYIYEYSGMGGNIVM
jgi:hypothetical protein